MSEADESLPPDSWRETGSFSDLVARLQERADPLCDEAVRAIDYSITQRNVEFQRAEEWRQAHEQCQPEIIELKRCFNDALWVADSFERRTKRTLKALERVELSMLIFLSLLYDKFGESADEVTDVALLVIKEAA